MAYTYTYSLLLMAAYLALSSCPVAASIIEPATTKNRSTAPDAGFQNLSEIFVGNQNPSASGLSSAAHDAGASSGGSASSEIFLGNQTRSDSGPSSAAPDTGVSMEIFVGNQTLSDSGPSSAAPDAGVSSGGSTSSEIFLGNQNRSDSGLSKTANEDGNESALCKAASWIDNIFSACVFLLLVMLFYMFWREQNGTENSGFDNYLHFKITPLFKRTIYWLSVFAAIFLILTASKNQSCKPSLHQALAGAVSTAMGAPGTQTDNQIGTQTDTGNDAQSDSEIEMRPCRTRGCYQYLSREDPDSFPVTNPSVEETTPSSAQKPAQKSSAHDLKLKLKEAWENPEKYPEFSIDELFEDFKGVEGFFI